MERNSAKHAYFASLGIATERAVHVPRGMLRDVISFHAGDRFRAICSGKKRNERRREQEFRTIRDKNSIGRRYLIFERRPGEWRISGVT